MDKKNKRRRLRKLLSADVKKKLPTDNPSPEDLETKSYKISYLYYKESLCEVNSLEVAPLRKVINRHKRFCKCKNTSEIFDLIPGIKPTYQSARYTDIFGTDLPVDCDIMYHFYIGSSERVFFFITQDIINIRAILNAHK